MIFQRKFVYLDASTLTGSDEGAAAAAATSAVFILACLYASIERDAILFNLQTSSSEAALADSAHVAEPALVEVAPSAKDRFAAQELKRYVVCAFFWQIKRRRAGSENAKETIRLFD